MFTRARDYQKYVNAAPLTVDLRVFDARRVWRNGCPLAILNVGFKRD
jgi:hypothetical protein